MAMHRYSAEQFIRSADERSDGAIFYALTHARVLIDRWREECPTECGRTQASGNRPPSPAAVFAGPPSAATMAARAAFISTVRMSFPEKAGARVGTAASAAVTSAIRCGSDTGVPVAIARQARDFARTLGSLHEKEFGLDGGESAIPALEAVINGFPAVALSLDIPASGLWHFALAAELSAPIIAAALEHGVPDWSALNVNIPNIPQADVKGTRLTRHGKSGFKEYYVEEKEENGRRKFRLEGSMAYRDQDTWLDAIALKEGYVSVTPLGLNMFNTDAYNHFKQWPAFGERP